MKGAARAILSSQHYAVLGTADRDGQPWTSPVWFALESFTALLWVSDPRSWHSLNIAVRPDISLVVFDSAQPPGKGEGVFMRATATEVVDVGPAVDIFSRRSREHGLDAWTPADVTGPAPRRLYRATVTEQYLGRHDRRVPVEL